MLVERVGIPPLLPRVTAGTFAVRPPTCALVVAAAPFAASLFAAAAPVFTLGGALPFTKRCCAPSYTIDESRLTVTGRLPPLLVRIVRDTRVGVGMLANFVASKVLRPGFFSTDHFCPSTGTTVRATLFPFTGYTPWLRLMGVLPCVSKG